MGCFVQFERVTRKTQELADHGAIAEFFSERDQSQLVFYYVLIEIAYVPLL